MSKAWALVSFFCFMISRPSSPSFSAGFKRLSVAKDRSVDLIRFGNLSKLLDLGSFFSKVFVNRSMLEAMEVCRARELSWITISFPLLRRGWIMGFACGDASM